MKKYQAVKRENKMAGCNHCKVEMESIFAVCEETNLYELTRNGDMEFFETRESDIVEYLCPLCFGILNDATVNAFRGNEAEGDTGP